MVKAKKVKARNKSVEVSAASGDPSEMDLDDDPASSPPKTKRKKLEEKPPVIECNDQTMNE